jgi:hypothetical protein
MTEEEELRQDQASGEFYRIISDLSWLGWRELAPGEKRYDKEEYPWDPYGLLGELPVDEWEAARWEREEAQKDWSWQPPISPQE